MKIRILIVEDERIVAEDLKFTLVSLGYDVIGIIDTGEMAVEVAIEKNPDIILMDIMLAGKMDGIEATEQIRTRAEIPVIYVTAYADEALLERAKVTGPFGYILKPFNEREIQSNIEIALYRSKTDREIKKRDAILLALGFGMEWFLRQIGEFYLLTPDVRKSPKSDEYLPILEQMGNAMNLSRIALFHCEDENPSASVFMLETEWTDPSVSPMCSSQNLREHGKERISLSHGDLVELKKGRPVYLSAGQSREGNSLSRIAPDLVSCAILPLIVADRFWGFLLFASDQERTWGGEEAEAMKIGSFILASAIGLLESVKK